MIPHPSPLRVLFLCAEASPLVKVGGLGDVGGSLPAALRQLGMTLAAANGNETTLKAPEGAPSSAIDIRVALPFYGAINRNRYKAQPVTSVEVPHANGAIAAEVFTLQVDRVPFYLIAGAPIHPQAPVYSADVGYDAHKFIFFSLAALETARKLDWQPHIVHCNDWHTAAAVYWLALHREQGAFFHNTASVLNIHNLTYLGDGAEFPMASFGLPPAQPGALPDWAKQLPLPLGLLTADHIVTVSPTYAQEIQASEAGLGMEFLLRQRADRLSGILNGIDYRRWNPEDDPAIPVTYTPESLFVREANKAALLNELGFIAADTGLEERNTPLLAMIARMDYQKGVDIVIEALYRLAREARQPWRAIILGSGLSELESSARRLQWYLPNQVRVVTRFDEPLSHRIYGGADLLMIPSRSESCGIVQMIAQHYGCLPVARATGGLKDTIRDYRSDEAATGFLFENPTPEDLLRTLHIAFEVFKDKPTWQAMQKRSMATDFSWKRSAHAYYELFCRLAAERARLTKCDDHPNQMSK